MGQSAPLPTLPALTCAGVTPQEPWPRDRTGLLRAAISLAITTHTVTARSHYRSSTGRVCACGLSLLSVSPVLTRLHVSRALGVTGGGGQPRTETSETQAHVALICVLTFVPEENNLPVTVFLILHQQFSHTAAWVCHPSPYVTVPQRGTLERTFVSGLSSLRNTAATRRSLRKGGRGFGEAEINDKRPI